ncbi:MAG TPA: peptide deformylase [Alphaproteobacteria bacterium]|nr:peptide deformylase [Alphaproteobacteria bacterium]
MAIRTIITAPDPRLKTVSEPVEAVDGGVRALVDDMFETMYDAPGIGLAAIQIGVPKRIVVMDLANEEAPPDPRCFVNPEVTWISEDLASYEEGCLSVPDYYAEVSRPAQARVKYLDRDGTACELDADGLLATCIQHEIDHLNGVLFVDHISSVRRSIILRKLTKAKRLAAAE